MENKEIDLKWGMRLKQLRNNNGITQEGLANATGISVRTIEDYEQGISKTPNAPTIFLLASFFDIDATTLLYGGSNTMFNIYADAVIEELKQIKQFDIIKKIHDGEFNGTILGKLPLTEELITAVQKNWDDNNLFDEMKDDGTVVKRKSYRTYIRDTILKYCQNRVYYLQKHDIKSGIEIINSRNGLI